MARRGPAHHKPRKQVRSLQAVVRTAPRVGQRDAQVVHGTRAEGQPPAVLAPPAGTPTAGDTDCGQAAWCWKVEFIHLKRSTRSIQRLLVYGPKSDIWSAGQAIATLNGTKYFEARLREERPQQFLSEYVRLSVACEGRYDPATNCVYPLEGAK